MTVTVRRCTCELRFSEPVEPRQRSARCGLPMLHVGEGLLCPCCDLADERAA